MSPDLILWAVLGTVIVGMLALDLFVFHRDAHEVSLREAGAWSVVWITLGLAFGAVVFATRGSQAGGEYLAGYLIEKSLSMDNVFLFAMLFGISRSPSSTSTASCSGASWGPSCSARSSSQPARRCSSRSTS